jgi:hypothetical protein
VILPGDSDILKQLKREAQYYILPKLAEMIDQMLLENIHKPADYQFSVGDRILLNANGLEKYSESILRAKKVINPANSDPVPVSGIHTERSSKTFICANCSFTTHVFSLGQHSNVFDEICKNKSSYLVSSIGIIDEVVGDCLIISGFATFKIHIPKKAVIPVKEA